jgi:hypothetical protein
MGVPPGQAQGATHLEGVTTTSVSPEVESAATSFTVELHSPDFTLPADLASYTRQKLVAKLARFGHRLLGVMVRVKDLNGPKGGEGGIACRMEARLAGMEPVNVDERDQDLRAAIDISIDRFELAVQRHVERARGLPRLRGRRLLRGGR